MPGPVNSQMIRVRTGGIPVVRDNITAECAEFARSASGGESAWSNGKPAYRCRHGHASATSPDPGRPKTTYVRETRSCRT
jgi:hypothetical protein